MEKVIWSEGLFLRPQHLQQQDRYVDYQIRRRLQLLDPFYWGFYRIDLDENLLDLGKVALTHGEGILPDGTLFSLPVDHIHPLVLDRDINEGDTIFLAVPAIIEGGTESHEDDDVLHSARYRTATSEVASSHGSRVKDVPITTGRLRARLATEAQLADRDVALPLCRIRECKPDGSLRLDTEYCPPVLTIEAAPRLLRQGKEILSLVQARAKALSERLIGASVGNVSSVADLMLLQALNRHVARLGLVLSQTQLHPFELYRGLVELSGDLATLCQDSRLAEAPSHYDHNHPAPGFIHLFVLLRTMLTRVFEQTAFSLPMQRRKFGLTVVPLSDMGMLRNNDFVIALKADVPGEQLAKLIPTRVKIGSVGKIREIVNLQLPGCKLTHLPTAPRQLPYHSGFCYFKLDPQKDIWVDTEQSGGFAVHVSGDVPGIEMQFWALRRT